MTIQELLTYTLQVEASDLHLVVGTQPVIRLHGELKIMDKEPILTPDSTRELVLGTMSKEQQDKFLQNKELDYSISMPGVGRFRANAYMQKGSMAGSFRAIGEKIKTIEELRLPKMCHTLATLKQGFVLVTGPTGSGKSSTLAAIIEEINQTRAENIITIEDPMEYVYSSKKSIISQRELGADTNSWTLALKSILREDPNVVLVGEMRDIDTMAAAITVAETGHLVFATLHTNSAAQTIDRIIDSFPRDQQPQIRMQLSNSIEAVLSQRLIPTVDGKGRIAVCEVMVATPAIKNTIREGKTHQIDSIIQTSAEMGMVTLETSMAYWIGQGVLSVETAREYSIRPGDLDRLIRR